MEYASAGVPGLIEKLRECDTCTEYYWTDESATRTITIDQDVAKLKSGVYDGMQNTLGSGRQAVVKYTEDGHRLIEGAIKGTDMQALTDEGFADHFGFSWQEGKVSKGWQVALTTLIGLPMSFVVLFYNKIWNKIVEVANQGRGYGYRSRSYYGYDSAGSSSTTDPEEIGNTRRAFFQLFVGGAASAFAFGSGDYYDRRSNEIRAAGTGKIRDAVVSANVTNQESYFQADSRVTPQELIRQSREYLVKLAGVTQEEVDRSVREGLDRVDDLERQLHRGISGATRSERTTRKERQYEPERISAYVAAAHRTAGELEGVLDEMEEYFADGVPAELLPAMRAYHVTKDVESAVSEEHSSHMWGLAGDLGKLYGAAFGLMLVSEIPTFHQKLIYNFVQGLCDLADRGRLSAFELFTGMKSQYTEREMSAVSGDTEIATAISANLKTLRDSAKDLADTGIVHDPVMARIYDTMTDGQRQTLAEQIAGIDGEKVTQAYIDKAILYFMKKQSGVKGLMQAISEGRDGKKPFKKAPVEDLRAKVLELMQNARGNFVIDLIEADLIDDNEPNENWISAETAKLPGYINYWAERVAGYFAASQDLYSALGILSNDWFTSRGQNELTSADVLTAFEAAIMEEIDTEAKKREIRQEIERKMNVDGDERILTNEEIAQRALLRKLQNAVESHHELAVLAQHAPKLKPYLTTEG